MAPATTSNSRPHKPWPKRRSYGQLVGGKKNNVRHALLKCVKKLINDQLVKDGRQRGQQDLSKRTKRAQRREEQRLERLQQETQERRYHEIVGRGSGLKLKLECRLVK